MGRRIIAGVLAVVLAAGGTAILVMYVRGAEERALAGQEVVDVLVATGEIARGTPADEIGDRVETRQVPANVRPEDSVDDLDALDGRVATVDLVRGEQIVASRFVDPTVFQAGQVDIPDGYQVVTIDLPPERAVGGQIAPGDTVGFIVSFGGDAEDGNGTDDEAAPETDDGPSTGFVLHKVLVTNVQGAGVPDNEDDTRDGVPEGNQMISLAVEAGDAERVVFAAEHGSIWLTNQPEDAIEDGTQIQRLDRIYP